MVEQVYSLDAVFGSLSDPTRRDILRRISQYGMSVSEIAHYYNMSLAAIAKHLTILERAGLVRKTRKGKERVVTLETQKLAEATQYLETYRRLWEERLDSLDTLVAAINKEGEDNGTS